MGYALIQNLEGGMDMKNMEMKKKKEIEECIRKFEKMAEEYERVGDLGRACIFKVEAGNWKKYMEEREAHKPIEDEGCVPKWFRAYPKTKTVG